jgi:hypothetical protein
MGRRAIELDRGALRLRPRATGGDGTVGRQPTRSGCCGRAASWSAARRAGSSTTGSPTSTSATCSRMISGTPPRAGVPGDGRGAERFGPALSPAADRLGHHLWGDDRRGHRRRDLRQPRASPTPATCSPTSRGSAQPASTVDKTGILSFEYSVATAFSIEPRVVDEPVERLAGRDVTAGCNGEACSSHRAS